MVEREVTVSFFRRLIDESVCTSEVRSSKRKNTPSSEWRRPRRLEATFRRTPEKRLVRWAGEWWERLNEA